MAVAVAVGVAAVPAAASARVPAPVLQLGLADPLLPGPPPLAPAQPTPAQTLVARVRIASRSVVHAAIDRSGRPRAVTVVQRLILRGTGDYAFAVPAPARDVVPGPGSQSRPGLRPGQVLWRGFSPGRKVLASRAVLTLGAVAGALPLRIAVTGVPARPGPFTLRVLITDATAARVSTYRADAVLDDAAAALDRLGEAAAAGRPAPPAGVRIRGAATPGVTSVSAALRVQGLVRFPARSVRDLRVAGPARTVSAARVAIRGRTGPGGTAEIRIAIQGVARRRAAPTVVVVATPDPAQAIPRPPARTWSQAVERRRTPRSGRRLLELAWKARLDYARSRQYETFLANPDLRGPNGTTYVFRTTSAAPAATPSTGTRQERGIPTVAVIAAVTLTAAALVVLWAHL